MSSTRFADFEFQDERASRQNRRITQLERRIEYLETAPRGEKETGIKQKLHRLDDEAGAEFTENGSIILYDTRAYTPRRITVITYGEMLILKNLFEDGCCPVCMAEIALNDIICDDCLAQARLAWKYSSRASHKAQLEIQELQNRSRDSQQS